MYLLTSVLPFGVIKNYVVHGAIFVCDPRCNSVTKIRRSTVQRAGLVVFNTIATCVAAEAMSTQVTKNYTRCR